MAVYDLPKVQIDDVARLIILKSGFTSFDVETDLYSDWKEAALANVALIGNNKVFRSVGGDGLSPLLNAGAYFFLQNQVGEDWRIRPAEQSATIIFTGSLVGENTGLPLLVPTLGAFTVLINGLQPITQRLESEDIIHASFDQGVTIDPIKGKTLASGAIGNSRQPLNNFTDAKTVATARGLTKLFINGPFTFGATDDLSNLRIVGVSIVTKNIFTITPGAITADTRFEECTVQGTLKGRIEAVGVVFGLIFDMEYDSWLLECWFDSDVALKGGGSFTPINCGSTAPPGSTARPTFDYADVISAKSNFLRWSGNIGYRNVTAGNIELNIGSGKVFLEANNTGGDIFIRPEHSDIDDETPVGGLTVHTELERFRVVADAGNTATAFKTDLTSAETDVYKDSIIQVLPTIAAVGLARQVKKVLSYNSTTKIITLTSALSSIPAVNTKIKVINE